MTNPIEALAVEQVDREAAKSLLGRDDAGPSWWSIDSGNADSDPLVQAFARHRLTALRSTTAEPVEDCRAAWDIAASALQTACETDPADPEHPDTVMLTTSDFETIVRLAVENHFEAHPTDSAAKDAALKACMNFAADERDRVIKLSEACERFLPKNICLSNSNVPDDLIIPLDVTMGELRNLAAALANRGEAGALAKERAE